MRHQKCKGNSLYYSHSIRLKTHIIELFSKFKAVFEMQSDLLYDISTTLGLCNGMIYVGVLNMWNNPLESCPNINILHITRRMSCECFANFDASHS